MPRSRFSCRRARAASGILIPTLFLLTIAAPRQVFAQGRDNQPPFHLISSSFSAGGFIPSRYTCSGENISPMLRWTDALPGTVAYALIVTDPDAPSHTWVHWVAYNLPGGERDLPAAIAKGNQIQTGGVQGMNDFHDVGYGGPCPPPGKPHRYFFTLYALNARLPLRPGATRRQVEQAMKGHILAQTTLMGLYGR